MPRCKKKKTPGLTRFSLRSTFLWLLTAFLCVYLRLLLQLIFYQWKSLSSFFIMRFFLASTASANFHTLNSFKLYYYLGKYKNKKHSIYHLTMLENLFLCLKMESFYTSDWQEANNKKRPKSTNKKNELITEEKKNVKKRNKGERRIEKK